LNRGKRRNPLQTLKFRHGCYKPDGLDKKKGLVETGSKQGSKNDISYVPMGFKKKLAKIL
jgi:hypothetical protein